MPILRKTINLTVDANDRLVAIDAATGNPTSDGGISGENNAVKLVFTVPSSWNDLGVTLYVIATDGTYDCAVASNGSATLLIKQAMTLFKQIIIRVVGTDASGGVVVSASCQLNFTQVSQPLDTVSATQPTALAQLQDAINKYTASDVLTKLKTVDGVGSGLDADTVDGNPSSAFAPSGFGLGTSATDVSNTDLNNLLITGFYLGQNLKNAPNSDICWFFILVMRFSDAFIYQEAISFGSVHANNVRYSRCSFNGACGAWSKVWSELTDGAGSGLDADTIDAMHGSHLVTKQDDASPGGQRLYRGDATDAYYVHTAWIQGQGWKINADTDTDDTQPCIHKVIVDRAYNADNANTVSGHPSTDFAPSGYGLGTYAADVSNGDANNLTITGFYRGCPLAHAPTASGNWWWIIVIGHDDLWTYQEAIGYGGTLSVNSIYRRAKNAGIWSDWVQIALEPDIAAHNSDSSAHAAQFAAKADLVNGQIPVNEIPVKYPSAVTSTALLNGWTGSITYWRDDYTVYILADGDGSGSTDRAFFTLPSGYRPASVFDIPHAVKVDTQGNMLIFGASDTLSMQFFFPVAR